MRRRNILAIIVAMVLPLMTNAATTNYFDTDTTKAVKIAAKAQKLLCSDKQKDIEKGISLYEQAANAGLKSAQRWMADFFWDMEPPRTELAMKWEQILANQGDEQAQFVLGWNYLGLTDNSDVEKDEVKGAYYMKLAAERGNALAQYIYANCLYEEIGVAKNLEESFAWMKKSADQGNLLAQFSMGVYYDDGCGCPVDYKKAFEYTKLAAEQGHKDAQYNLGRQYHLGIGVEKNLDEAIYWYTKASEQNDGVAKNNLALALEEKNGNSNEVLYLLRKSADEGDKVAQYNLGARYQEGNGVTQDAAMASYYYTKSANSGYAPAQRQLGGMYLIGNEEVDYDKAFYWISKAADQKDTLAVSLLGFCYENGYGTTADAKKAFRCFMESYELGYDKSLIQISRCYFSGIGVDQSYEQAFLWNMKACDKNIARGFFNVAYMSECGLGIIKNYTNAIKYYEQYIDVNGCDEHGDANFGMGNCYSELSKELGRFHMYKAAECFKKSAALGNFRAKYNLALLYYYGDVLSEDMAKCKSLLRECASQDEDQEVKETAKNALSLIQ